MATAEERQAQLIKMGQLAEDLYQADEEVRAALDKAAETKHPGIQARKEAQRIVLAGKQELQQEQQKFRDELAAQRALIERERRLSAIKSDPELAITDADIPEIEKHMLERGIGNYDDGAYSWRRLHRREVAPAVSSRRRMDMTIPGVGEDGLKDGLDWMKGVIGQNGVNLSLLDRRTKEHVDTILADYDRDAESAERKWGTPPPPKSRWMGI